jgi:hypothetical protein
LRDRHALPHGLLDQGPVPGAGKMSVARVLPSGETAVVSGPFSEEVGAAALATEREKEPGQKFILVAAN